MAHLPSGPTRQAKRLRRHTTAFIRDPKVRYLAIPLVVAAAAALSVTHAIQAASNDTAAKASASQMPTVTTNTHQEATPMPANTPATPATPDQASATHESVNDTGNGATTQVMVNGQAITVPANGSYHRSTDNGGTRTDLDIDSHHSSNASGDGSSVSSSSNVQVNMQSNSTSSGPSQ